MAGRDYILCRDCGDKLIYDGSDNIRSRLEKYYGDPSACDWTVELVCPPCLKKIEDKQQAEPVVEHPNIAGMKAALDALARQQAEPVIRAIEDGASFDVLEKLAADFRKGLK